MTIDDLVRKFSSTAEDREKAIFSTLFIAGNRLQTLFDSRIPEVTLKQFMLLTLVKQSPEPMTLTRLGEMLGCSRQNVRKLADALQKKGFVHIEPGHDSRSLCLVPTEKMNEYFERDFSRYQQELKYLFEVYSEEEVATLFTLMMKLYAGIDNLEQKT